MGGSRLYKAYAPYPDTVVSDLDFAQSADVMYTVHLDYPVYRITRSAHTTWTYTPVTFGPTISIPAAPSGVANKPNMTGYMATNYSYKITAVGGTNEQESRPSTSITLVNDLTLNGNTNVLTMPAFAAGVTLYIIYKSTGGLFGYIGSTETLSFTDGSPQLQAVLSDTPPTGQNPFASPNYPSTVAFHDQRAMFGGTRALPNAVWGSQPADFENFDTSRPNKPDDALSFALVAEKVNSVQQLVSMDDLMTFTSNGVFSVNGGVDSAPLTPSSIVPKRENSRGGSRLNPIVLDDIIFYTPSKGSAVRTIGFKFEIDGYQSNDITIFSPHFFKGRTVTSWAYVEEPYSAIFAVLDDGGLLCFTWEAEQQVWGWTQLETNGLVLDITAITEGGYDRLYALIQRTINGVARKFHERLALPHVDDITTACHLDCAVTQVYDPPRNVISGLWHINGATVSAHYDGYVAEGLVVVNGAVTLPNGYEATVSTVGLPFTGTIETLPMVMTARDGSMHINTQNIADLVLRTVDTRGIVAGITGTTLEAAVEREGGETGLPDVSQRDYPITPPGTWRPSTTITIEQNQPLPAHITGLFVKPRVSPK